MKKKIFGVLGIIMLVGALSACAGRDGTMKFNSNILAPITYTQTSAELNTNDDELSFRAQAGKITTGTETKFYLKPAFSFDASADPAMEAKSSYYVIMDWGDGTWSYNGPFLNLINKNSNAFATHIYKKAGTYQVRGALRFLSESLRTEGYDTFYGWTSPRTITVTGEDYQAELPMINGVAASASSAKAGHPASNLIDGKDTYWVNKEAGNIDEVQWAGLMFDDSYRMDSVEIKLPKEVETFPSNISLDYTTDHGKTWYSAPKYYYLYDYSINRFQPMMYFPNPKGATLIFKLDGLVANGVRLSSRMFDPSDYMGKLEFGIEEMRVYGDERELFYSSMDDQFNADVNNMWTIFGSAKSEPQIVGSLLGESQNTSPFRTGSAMIGSTEWFEWNGLKHNWGDYYEVQDIHLQTLVTAKYGSTDWTSTFPGATGDGYIYATPTDPKHLGVQNHYIYNSVYIMAVKDYLFSGNNVEGFFGLKNSAGQSIEQKIDKAMKYQLYDLEGVNGLLTIKDPANDATVDGNASNYWDVMKIFGYKSSYENVFFYGSLLAMQEIDLYRAALAEAAGDSNKKADYETSAQYYATLATQVKNNFNSLFWDSDKGRYIGSINKNGTRLDFGTTYTNFMACAYGLASKQQAELIYSWMEGERIIETDTSKGKDIYGEFKYAARGNTVDISSVNVNGKYYWWDHGGQLKPTPGEFGGFNMSMQNGGTIFYISYYDLLGRLTISSNKSFDFFKTIVSEFHKDSLRRNSYTNKGEYREGVIGEFPESGLVPLSFLRAYIGVSATHKGLEIKPNLPSEMSYAGVRRYTYGNRVYSIRVDKSIAAPKVEKVIDADGSIIWYVQVPAGSTYYITPDNTLVKGA